MISKKVFAADGSNQRFLSDFIIRSEQFTRVYNYVYDINGTDGDVDPSSGLYVRITDIPASTDLVTIDKWDLVDNSISFYASPYTGSRVYIEVATTAEEFGSTLIQPSVEQAQQAAAEAEASEIAAAASEAAAALSEAAAALSETNAAASAAAALASQNAAALSETNASASEVAAGLSEAAAALSEAAAALSETNAASSETAAGLSETNSVASAVAAAANAVAAEASEIAAKASEDAVAADLILTNADVVLTHADVALTNSDVLLTGADLTATNADVVLTHADVALTNADVVLTNADAAQTALDKTATNADVVLTHADVVLTGADVTSSATSAAAALASEIAAAASAVEAAASATLLDADKIVAKTTATGSAELPVGTTAQRDGTPSAGMIRFNSDDAGFEGHDGTAWGSIGVDPTAEVNADKLDGIDSGSFLRSDATDYLTSTIYLRGDLVGADDGYRDHGVFGNYDSTKTDHIWSMGTSYRNSADGSGLGNLYGLAYDYNVNSVGHGVHNVQNGVVKASIGSNIWTSGNVTAYSDARVKENLEVIQDAMSKISQLNGYTYDRTDIVPDDLEVEYESIHNPSGRHVGLIAQEVLEVLPEAVMNGPSTKEGTEDEHYSVSYGNVVALLIEGMKELHTKIEILEKREK